MTSKPCIIRVNDLRDHFSYHHMSFSTGKSAGVCSIPLKRHRKYAANQHYNHQLSFQDTKSDLIRVLASSTVTIKKVTNFSNSLLKIGMLHHRSSVSLVINILTGALCPAKLITLIPNAQSCRHFHV